MSKDIMKIQDILEKFPDVEVFELEQDSSSGIGSVTTMSFVGNVTTMSFDHEINALRIKVSIEISGVEDW
jgi:hypothetical protein